MATIAACAAARRAQIAKYRGRLSGPLRDRIDLIVEVPALPVAAIAEGEPGEVVGASFGARVLAARDVQQARYGRWRRANQRRSSRVGGGRGLPARRDGP